MAKETKAILESAISQLEAKKTQIFNTAKAVKENELSNEYKQFESQKNAELNSAIASLQASYRTAIDAKKAEISSIATAYANERVKAVDEEIEVLKGILEDDNGEV